MGSDMHMNPPYEPPPKASTLVARLETRNVELEQRLGAVIAEKSRLEEQARRDADTIVRLTRERDHALRDAADGHDVN